MTRSSPTPMIADEMAIDSPIHSDLMGHLNVAFRLGNSPTVFITSTRLLPIGSRIRR